jgi:uncharacterized membrane protein YhaH (DUF805 family)
MGPLTAIGRCYANILTFSGRARRAEYWWFSLFLFLGGVIVQVALAIYMIRDPAFMALMRDAEQAAIWFKQSGDLAVPAAIAGAGYILLVWLPHLTVTVRRLHDTDRSGWYILMPLAATLLAIGAMFPMAIMPRDIAMPLLFFLALVPLGASLWFLVILCLPGSHGSNRFGPDPIKTRKRKAPDHPAFAPQYEPEERAAIEAQRRREIKEYYRKHVLKGART